MVRLRNQKEYNNDRLRTHGESVQSRPLSVRRTTRRYFLVHCERHAGHQGFSYLFAQQHSAIVHYAATQEKLERITAQKEWVHQDDTTVSQARVSLSFAKLTVCTLVPLKDIQVRFDRIFSSSELDSHYELQKGRASRLGDASTVLYAVHLERCHSHEHSHWLYATLEEAATHALLLKTTLDERLGPHWNVRSEYLEHESGGAELMLCPTRIRAAQEAGSHGDWFWQCFNSRV